MLLNDPRFFWNEETIHRFANEALISFRTEWKTQQNAEAMARKKANQQKNRRTGRRKDACTLFNFTH